MYKYPLIAIMSLYPTLSYSYNCLDSENYLKPDALLDITHLHNTALALEKEPLNEYFVILAKDADASLRNVIFRAEQANNHCATSISFSEQLDSLFEINAEDAQKVKRTALTNFPECNFYINYTFDLLEINRLAMSFDAEAVPIILSITGNEYKQ